MNKIKTRKMSLFGHVQQHETILKQVIEGKMNRKRGRDRPRAS